MLSCEGTAAACALCGFQHRRRYFIRCYYTDDTIRCFNVYNLIVYATTRCFIVFILNPDTSIPTRSTTRDNIPHTLPCFCCWS